MSHRTTTLLAATIAATFLLTLSYSPAAEAVTKCGCKAKHTACTIKLFGVLFSGKAPKVSCFAKRDSCLKSCRDKRACKRACRQSLRTDLGLCDAAAKRTVCRKNDKGCRKRHARAKRACKRLARSHKRDCKKTCRR